MRKRDPFQVDYLEGKKVEQSDGEITTHWDEALATRGQEANEVRTVNPLFDYRKIRIFSVAIILVFAALILRLVQLQVWAGDDFKSAAAENRFRINIKKTVRGIIYDADKDILVRNVPSFDLVFTPADLPEEETERNKLLEEVKKYSGIGDNEFAEAIKDIQYNSYTPVLVKRNLDREKTLYMQPRLNDMPGIDIEVNAMRHYEDALSFAHVLGYVGRITEQEMETLGEYYQPTDTLGKSGLESYYEEVLRGEHGQEQVEVDSRGKVKEVVAVNEPVAGSDLVLTIDRDLQLKVSEIVDRNLENLDTKKAAVVMMEPDTGKILSLVSSPGYDNNVFTEGILTEDYNRLISDKDKPLFNRVVNGVYPPGSTIKPVVATAALEERVITQNTVIEDTGSISVPNKYNSDVVYNFVGWNLSGLGPMNVYSAIAKSSDIYFYEVGGGFEGREGLGVERLEKYYKKFGLGEKTGLDLPGEKKGLIPTPDWKEDNKAEEWYLGDTYHMAIGQGDVLTTPLQVANWTATIANGGTVYRPYIVQKMIDNDRSSIKETYPRSARESIASSANIKIVQRAMRETVLDGSGRALNTLPFTSAGKTGTAQHSGDGDNHAWYTAYAPYDDPEVVVTVLVEEGGGGDKVAVPIAGQIMSWYFQNQNK